MSFFRSKAERQLTELKKFNETFQNLNSEKNYDSMISALTAIVNGWDTLSSEDRESAVKQCTSFYRDAKDQERRRSWRSAPLSKLLGRSSGRRGTTSASATLGTAWESLGPDCGWFDLPRPHPPIMDPIIDRPPVDTRHEPRAIAREHAGEPGSSGVAAFSDCVTPPRRPDTSPSPGAGIASQHPDKLGSFNTRLASLCVWIRICPDESLDRLPCVGLPVASCPVEIIATNIISRAIGACVGAVAPFEPKFGGRVVDLAHCGGARAGVKKDTTGRRRWWGG
ncbi:hypothetical protein B0H13DRAFT_2653928 [Mycena leptocephala]|nr:hypothetical protein B0H13DRAFT_2653928 [Mycena leptocephala]